MDFIDFVVVNVDEDVRVLCKAPSFSHLKNGDKVMLNDYLMADVIISDTFPDDEKNSAVKMILEAFNRPSIKEVPSLKAKVDIRDFIY